jgi:hypothetical protein
MSNQIQIDHSWGDLEEGETSVMNLRDTNVLKGDSDGKLVFENIDLKAYLGRRFFTIDSRPSWSRLFYG